MQDTNVTIIGAGPYGLSAAAFLRAAGVETRVFGEPMAFWKNRMPAGMFLRSNWKASCISDPEKKVTMDAYCAATGNHVSAPVPLEQFVQYGLWYQARWFLALRDVAS
jgi:cation diffusion facilitator CzcD-associated flavoprotein CzcO